jgi:hypothetical protein
VTAKILTLIDLVENSAVIRDQIAAILLVESTKQQELAAQADEDPRLRRLRIFTEASNPWSEWIDAPNPHDNAIDTSPIVNVSFDSATWDRKGSNSVERQKTIGVFNVDCYGYGVSSDGDTEGHDAGDRRAALEAQRAYALVRKILMAGEYTYLQLQGTVGNRWPESVQIQQPAIDGRPMQHVVAARFALKVEFNEFSPQVEGVILETVAVTVKRKETGEIYFTAAYGEPI